MNFSGFKKIKLKACEKKGCAMIFSNSQDKKQEKSINLSSLQKNVIKFSDLKKMILAIPRKKRGKFSVL